MLIGVNDPSLTVEAMLLSNWRSARRHGIQRFDRKGLCSYASSTHHLEKMIM